MTCTSIHADDPVGRFATEVQPVLRSQCGRCHNQSKMNGGIDFSGVGDARSILKARINWRKSIAQLKAGIMPPTEETPLTPEQRSLLLDWMIQTVQLVESGTLPHDPGPAQIRRLSLAEYHNTVRDLLGVEFDAAEAVGMTDDIGEGNTFGNLAAGLDIPAALMDKYFAAADKILDRFFGVELSSHVDGGIQDKARKAREKLFSLNRGSWRNSTQVITPPDKVPPREAAHKLMTGFLRRAYRRPVLDAEVQQLLTLFDRATAKNESYVNSIRLMLKAVLVSPKFLYRIEQDIDPGSGQPYQVPDHDLAARLSYFLWSSLPDERLQTLADHHLLSKPGAWLEPAPLSGTVIGTPVRPEEPNPSLNAVFDGDLESFYEAASPDGAWVGLDLHVPKRLTRIRYAPFIGRNDRLIGGILQASNSADFSTGVVDLFTITAKPPDGFSSRDLQLTDDYRYVRYLGPKNGQGNIAELEIWGVSPGTVLEQEVARMLDDPRARALTDNFAANWLQIRKVSTARPSTEFFPEFQPDIRKAMYDETASFFDGLRRENRSILELLDADYTYVNEELAKYYKLAPVQGKHLRRVALKPDAHRGGLLGMGSVLALTSHTSRTSPSQRGKWVLEVIFGTPPPPPPANAGMFKDEKDKAKEPKTFREKLAQHARDASCASCHKRMDPLGFALENFNAVGSWRDKDRDQPVDASGELPTGEKLNGVAELKKIVLKRSNEFERNVAEQLLTYALGRELDYTDDASIAAIGRDLDRDGHRFSTLILGVVKSYPFQHRRSNEIPKQ